MIFRSLKNNFYHAFYDYQNCNLLFLCNISFHDDTLYVVHNSAYEEMYIDLYNTINIYMINYNIIFFVVRIGSRGYSYNIFNLQVIIIRFSLSNP